jgi:hypothetical protein
LAGALPRLLDHQCGLIDIDTHRVAKIVAVVAVEQDRQRSYRGRILRVEPHLVNTAVAIARASGWRAVAGRATAIGEVDRAVAGGSGIAETRKLKRVDIVGRRLQPRRLDILHVLELDELPGRVFALT